jgi:hypothetical protein
MKKFLYIGLGGILILGGVWVAGEVQLNKSTGEKIVSAQEIYPLFECPCCGKPINECTCPMAKERRAFVEGLAAGGLEENEAVFTYLQKYGLASFVDETKEKEYRQKLVEKAPADRPIISLTTSFYNFGGVSQEKGVTTTAFELQNTGKSDLVIEKLETSCGCTSASIIYQGKEGPRFSMPGHGINEKIGEWQITIPAGDSALLKVYYDPNVHKDFRGPAVREIYIFSNDPIDFEKKVSIELNQID